VRWLESLAAEARSLDAYLREIARFPELTVTEERRLAERVRRRDEDAVAQLAASQLGLVLRYAQKYRHLGVSLVDLVHDGNLALLDAARRFHPDRHGRFASYALWWVRQGVLHRLSQVPFGAQSLDADARAACLSPALRVIVERAGRRPTPTSRGICTSRGAVRRCRTESTMRPWISTTSARSSSTMGKTPSAPPWHPI
jgi:RNA polymerase sigma factor (sigma-70 family)